MTLVKAELRKQGIVANKVRKKPTSLLGKRKKRISPLDIAVFTRQLATMMKAGVPLVQSFDIVAEGHDNASMRELLLRIKSDIEGGNNLANSLKQHPIYFDDLFCSLCGHASKITRNFQWNFQNKNGTNYFLALGKHFQLLICKFSLQNLFKARFFIFLTQLLHSTNINNSSFSNSRELENEEFNNKSITVPQAMRRTIISDQNKKCKLKLPHFLICAMTF